MTSLQTRLREAEAKRSRLQGETSIFRINESEDMGAALEFGSGMAAGGGPREAAKTSTSKTAPPKEIQGQPVSTLELSGAMDNLFKHDTEALKTVRTLAMIRAQVAEFKSEKAELVREEVDDIMESVTKRALYKETGISETLIDVGNKTSLYHALNPGKPEITPQDISKLQGMSRRLEKEASMGLAYATPRRGARGTEGIYPASAGYAAGAAGIYAAGAAGMYPAGAAGGNPVRGDAGKQPGGVTANPTAAAHGVTGHGGMKLAIDQCRKCLGRGHFAAQCPFNNARP
jgi:hypothetical protein